VCGVVAAADTARVDIAGVGSVDPAIRAAIVAALSVAGDAQVAIAVFELSAASDGVRAAIPVVAPTQVLPSLALVGLRIWIGVMDVLVSGS